MPSSSEWEMPLAVQPKPENYAYDLDVALSAMVGLRAIIPADAFTAETLGTERTGNGVLPVRYPVLASWFADSLAAAC